MDEQQNKKLTPKQQAFVIHFTDNTNKQTFNNATQASIAAGYSAKTAHNMVNRLLANVGIKAEIEAIQAKKREKLEYNQEIAHKLLLEQLEIAKQQKDVPAAVSCIREMDTIYALRTENITTTDLTEKQRLEAEKAVEAEKIATIRLDEFKQVKTA